MTRRGVTSARGDQTTGAAHNPRPPAASPSDDIVVRSRNRTKRPPALAKSTRTGRQRSSACSDRRAMSPREARQPGPPSTHGAVPPRDHRVGPNNAGAAVVHDFHGERSRRAVGKKTDVGLQARAHRQKSRPFPKRAGRGAERRSTDTAGFLPEGRPHPTPAGRGGRARPPRGGGRAGRPRRFAGRGPPTRRSNPAGLRGGRGVFHRFREKRGGGRRPAPC
jgi:hypothetical protein